MRLRWGSDPASGHLRAQQLPLGRVSPLLLWGVCLDSPSQSLLCGPHLKELSCKAGGGGIWSGGYSAGWVGLRLGKPPPFVIPRVSGVGHLPHPLSVFTEALSGCALLSFFTLSLCRHHAKIFVVVGHLLVPLMGPKAKITKREKSQSTIKIKNTGSSKPGQRQGKGLGARIKQFSQGGSETGQQLKIRH